MNYQYSNNTGGVADTLLVKSKLQLPAQPQPGPQVQLTATSSHISK